MAKLNKDFYDRLPGMVCVMLDKMIKQYGDQSWFPKAWEEYRQHVLTSDMEHMRTPGYVFKKYVEDSDIEHSDVRDPYKYGVPEQKKFPLPDAEHVRSAIKFFNYVDPKYEKQLARFIIRRAKEYNVDLSEIDIGDNNRFKKYLPNELAHHGILGQKWGVRRFENPDGTLTPAGKKRYSKKEILDAREKRDRYRKDLRELKNQRDRIESDETYDNDKVYKLYRKAQDLAIDADEPEISKAFLEYQKALEGELKNNKKYKEVEAKINEMSKEIGKYEEIANMRTNNEIAMNLLEIVSSVYVAHLILKGFMEDRAGL